MEGPASGCSSRRPRDNRAQQEAPIKTTGTSTAARTLAPGTASDTRAREAVGEPQLLQPGRVCLLASKASLQLLLGEARALSQQGRSSSPSSVFLVGCMTVSGDNSLVFRVDRFDPGKGEPRRPTVLIPGDVPVRVSVGASRAEMPEAVSGLGEWAEHCDRLVQQCRTQDELAIQDLLHLEAACCPLGNGTLLLRWQGLRWAHQFQATPVLPVPLLDTGLLRRLQGPPGQEPPPEPETGLLTMDQTRRLVVAGQADAVTAVGIWVSGVAAVADLFVWAACLRFMHSERISDRALAADMSFLLLHFSPSRSPEPVLCECKLLGLAGPPFALSTHEAQLELQNTVGTVVVDLFPDDQQSPTSAGVGGLVQCDLPTACSTPSKRDSLPLKQAPLPLEQPRAPAKDAIIISPLKSSEPDGESPRRRSPEEYNPRTYLSPPSSRVSHSLGGAFAAAQPPAEAVPLAERPDRAAPQPAVVMPPWPMLAPAAWLSSWAPWAQHNAHAANSMPMARTPPATDPQIQRLQDQVEQLQEQIDMLLAAGRDSQVQCAATNTSVEVSAGGRCVATNTSFAVSFPVASALGPRVAPSPGARVAPPAVLVQSETSGSPDRATTPITQPPSPWHASAAATPVQRRLGDLLPVGVLSDAVARLIPTSPARTRALRVVASGDRDPNGVPLTQFVPDVSAFRSFRRVNEDEDEDSASVSLLGSAATSMREAKAGSGDASPWLGVQERLDSILNGSMASSLPERRPLGLLNTPEAGRTCRLKASRSAVTLQPTSPYAPSPRHKTRPSPIAIPDAAAAAEVVQDVALHPTPTHSSPRQLQEFEVSAGSVWKSIEHVVDCGVQTEGGPEPGDTTSPLAEPGAATFAIPRIQEVQAWQDYETLHESQFDVLEQRYRRGDASSNKGASALPERPPSTTASTPILDPERLRAAVKVQPIRI